MKTKWCTNGTCSLRDIKIKTDKDTCIRCYKDLKSFDLGGDLGDLFNPFRVKGSKGDN